MPRMKKSDIERVAKAIRKAKWELLSNKKLLSQKVPLPEWLDAMYKAQARAAIKAMRAENADTKPNASKPCKAVIWAGPGHQSRIPCDKTGPHRQHAAYRHGFYWSKKESYSGFFDESPEEPGQDNPTRRTRRKRKPRAQGGRP